jgi:hypothetical protein
MRNASTDTFGPVDPVGRAQAILLLHRRNLLQLVTRLNARSSPLVEDGKDLVAIHLDLDPTHAVDAEEIYLV